jgi:hypothetical protein
MGNCLTLSLSKGEASKMRHYRCGYFRASRHSIAAMPVAMTAATPLTHIGMNASPIVTCQPKASRKTCASATTSNKTEAIVVKGLLISCSSRGGHYSGKCRGLAPGAAPALSMGHEKARNGG